VVCREGDDLVVASSTGRMLRLAVNESNLPVMGRNAQGPVLIRLLPGERVVGAAAASAEGAVLLASRQGQLKRLSVTGLRRCERGDLGQIGVRFLERGDSLVDLQEDSAAVLGVVLGEGRSLRLLTDQLNPEDSTGAGQGLGLKPSELVQELIPLIS
jgi:DNA gyrase subunit A